MGWLILVATGVVGVLIYAGCSAIAEALERLTETLKEDSFKQRRHLDQIADKLGNLWSPLAGINNAQHGKTDGMSD